MTALGEIDSFVDITLFVWHQKKKKENIYPHFMIFEIFFQKLLLMIKPHGEARVFGVANDISYFDPGSEDVRTPMMNGKTMEDKV